MTVRRRQVHALAYHHQSGSTFREPWLPVMEMYVDKVPEGPAALAAHPVFQVAPLGSRLRAWMMKPEQQRRFCKDVRLSREGPIEAIIWSPVGLHPKSVYALARSPKELYSVYRSSVGDNTYRLIDHWICMTRDHVWTAAGGERDHMALGSIVHYLKRLDFDGRPLPPKPQGRIPSEDEDALGGLAL